jgi:transposase
MSRTFKTADYAAALELQVRLGDCLPPGHPARFVADTRGLLDLSPFYARYGPKGGQPYDPALLLGVLFYGYVSGVFSTRKLERAPYESIPLRYLAGDLHPDHDTIAAFRRACLPEIGEAVVQILLVAQQAGVLEWGAVSQDGTKVHAAASKSQAVSYGRLVELEPQLRAAVARRQARLEQLALARAVLEARAAERYAAEQAAYAAKSAERAARAARTGKKPGGRPPRPPTPGPRPTDQYNFTDPDSRIMKNSTDAGFDQHYHAQVVVDQASLLVVGTSLSNHPNDQQELEPTLDASPPALGTPAAVALDAGFFSAANIRACERRGIEPYIAPGREAHQQPRADLLAAAPAPPPEGASPRAQMASTLRTPLGQAIYRARKRTVAPAIGIIKEVLGFRQCSPRGERAAAGEWRLVCLAYNLKRLHALLGGVLPSVALARRAQEAQPGPIGCLRAACRLLFERLFHYRPGAAAQQRSARRATPPIISFSPFSPTGC